MLKIHEYGQVGQPTIVFLHGLGVSSWMWTDQVTVLQESYHCLAIDLPGNGESFGMTWHSLADSAAQVADVIQSRAADGRAHVVGLSLGGYVALNLLVNRDDVVQSMIVSGISTSAMIRPSLNNAASKLSAWLVKRKFMAKLSAKMMQLPEDVVPLYHQDIERLSAQAIQRVYEEVLQFNLPKLPWQKVADLLVVAGEKEANAVLKGLPHVVKAYPQTAVAIAPNAHHGWNAEHPDLFTEMIQLWISDRTLPDALKQLSGKKNRDPVT